MWERQEHMKVHHTTLKTGIARTKEFEKKGLAAFSVNVGTKCGHGCINCSTGSMLRMHPSFRDAGENPFGTGFAILDPSTPERVAADAKKIKVRGVIQLCTTVDAWAPEAQVDAIGRRCLEAILSEPGWTVPIRTKNAAVLRDFDLIERHRDRVLVGISMTATESKANLVSVIEPNASTIPERMHALREAHRRGLRVYGMLCPLIPGVACDRTDLEELIDFSLECGAEEIFAEPINGRGPGLKRTAEQLAAAGFSAAAGEVNRVRSQEEWSRYMVRLLRDIRQVLAARRATDKLRFLLYPARLVLADREWVQNNMLGVKWLEKEKRPRAK
jgi:DNA repair photolyase